MKVGDDESDACRIDVWLWRARLFKTRSLVAQVVEAGRIRRTRANVEQRLDKASRSVRPGDVLVFALGGKVSTVRVTAVGTRRGPPQEARGLYVEWKTLDDLPAPDLRQGAAPLDPHPSPQPRNRGSAAAQ